MWVYIFGGYIVIVAILATIILGINNIDNHLWYNIVMPSILTPDKVSKKDKTIASLYCWFWISFIFITAAIVMSN